MGNAAETYSIVSYRTTYMLDDDGGREEIASYSEEFTMVPDEIDVEAGLDTPFKMAVDFLLHSACPVEASVYPLTNARRGTWLAAEPYVNPYTAEVEETTYHFEGSWADDEVRQIVLTVLER